jgi:hypothetical protein
MQFFAIHRLSYAAACVAIAMGAMAQSATVAKAAGAFRVVAPINQIGFVSPAFDSAGRVVLGDVVGAWVEESNGLAPKLSAGSQAPGFPAGTLIGRLSMSSPILQKGPPAFVAELQDHSYAVYVDEPGVGLRVASLTGKTIDPSGVQVVDFRGHGSTLSPEPIANDSGDVLMYGRLQGGLLGGVGFGAWIERPGGPQLVFHSNTTMPGIGSKFGDYPSWELAFENTGRVATVNSFADGKGLWVFDAPGVVGGRLAARSGTVRHGIPISTISHVHMANWRIAFHGGERGVFAETNGVSELIAGEGRAAPGFGPGASYRFFRPESTAMNRHGDLAFVGEVADPALPGGVASAIWVETVAGPVQLALNLGELLGSTAPGSGLATARDVVMNDDGQLAFMGIGANGGLWRYDPVAGAQRIAAVGEQMLLDFGGAPTMKTISEIRVGGFLVSGLNPAQYLSDDGEIVFLARFTDNSNAVVVWSPVPEPASLMLAAWFAAAAARGRRSMKA